MTNEELLRLYYETDDEMLLEKLHIENEGLIIDIAKKVAATFNCLRYRENTKQYTAYTEQILDELKSEGALEFIRLIREGNYDETKGKLTTYIYPYIQGIMRRWMERNLDYNAHIKSNCDLVYESDDGGTEPRNPYEYLIQQADSVSVSHTVYIKICIEKLRELFLSLPEKDRYILGHSLGVFGYERKSLDEIAMDEMLTTDGVIKARNAAIRRIREMYPDSNLCLWRTVYHKVMREVEQYCD